MHLLLIEQGAGVVLCAPQLTQMGLRLVLGVYVWGTNFPLLKVDAFVAYRELLSLLHLSRCCTYVFCWHPHIMVGHDLPVCVFPPLSRCGSSKNGGQARAFGTWTLICGYQDAHHYGETKEPEALCPTVPLRWPQCHKGTILLAITGESCIATQM